MIGKTVSHYKILEKLGEGGMGVVYKARDTRLDRFVALKFLPPELTSDESVRSRFINEARAASSLDHPNIAVVHEIGELEDGTSFICMAFYEGETLRTRIDRGPIEIQQTIGIARQICGGLQRAHDAGIIHRDIKPANIMVTPDGTVKIVDFGLAKLSGQLSASDSGKLVGTTAYMSPEQIQGNAVDHRSDLFSFGIVLYEMLTGRRPFTGEHEATLLFSIVHDDPPPLSSIRSGIPPAMERITLRLLQKDPGNRFQSAASVVDAMDASATGLTFAMPSVLHRLFLRAGTRKSRIVIAVAAVTAVILTLSILTRRPGISIVATEFVMLADVENNTTDRELDHSLSEAMTVSLRQSAHLNLLSPDRIMGALERMKVPGDQRLTDSTALSVARREGARVMIAAAINRLGSAYVISGKLVDVANGTVVNLARRQVPKIEDVMPEIDGLCKDIRKLLGESLPDITASALPLEQVTTPSLKALELHSRSMRLQRQGEYQEAAFLEEGAIHEDSLFAMAVSELSYIYRKLGNDSLSLYYHHRAHTLMNRVTDRERLYMSALYWGPSFELDLPKAYDYLHQSVVRYPNDAEAFSLLGWLAMYDGNTNAAIEAFQRSLAIDSVTYGASIYNNWGYTLALGGDGARAREFYHKSKNLRPKYSAIDGYIAQAHWITEAPDSAERGLRQALSYADGQEKLSRYMELASLYEFSGALPRAQGVCREAIDDAKKMKRPGDEAYFHYLLGELAAELSDPAGYAAELKQAEKLCRSPYFELPLIGSSYARRGRLGECNRILSLIGSVKSDDPFFLRRRHDYVSLVNGDLLAANKSYMKAGQQFQSVERLYGGDPLFLLARKGAARCAELQGDSNAATMYGELLEKRGEVVMACVRNARTSGFWIRELWTDIDLALGKWYRTRGDRIRAEEHIRNSLKFSMYADRRDQRTREAKEILTQLTGVR